MTIELSTTDKRDGRALALFARWEDWQRGKTKDGRSFFAIPGSAPGLFHMTDQRACSCPDFQRAGNLCKHVRAVRLWMAAYQTGAVAPKRRPTPPTPNVVDDLGIGDERVALTPAGAAFLLAARAESDGYTADQDDPDEDGDSDERPVTDEDRAFLTQLRQEQRRRAVILSFLGWTPDEYHEDGQFSKRAEWIERLAARIDRTDAAAPPPTDITVAAPVAV